MGMDIVCFGELLIDFVSTERGVSVGEAPSFAKVPGGAPANVAVGLAKLGVPTAFLGQVGEDPFGHYLAGVLESAGVDIAGLRFTAAANTPLAFVSVAADGERSFMFYRNPSADMLMTPASLHAERLTAAKIFHFGSITLIDDPVRAATLAALDTARRNGLLISYDPNLRLPLWRDETAAREGLLIGLEYAKVVKANREEVEFLAQTTDIEAGVKQLWRDETRLFVVTLGAEGCIAFTRNNRWDMTGHAVQVEDTLGAGDAFMAGLLSGIWARGKTWRSDDLTPLLERANAAGALATTRRGAIPALPTDLELQQFLAQLTP